MTEQHMPTPWRVMHGRTYRIWGTGPVGELYGSEDAAFIVRACNAHEQLVEALGFYAIIHSDLGAPARAALAALEA